MNNLSNNIVSNIKQLVDDVLLSFITLTVKLWAYILIKPKFENQIWMNTMSFINSDLNKQAQALSYIFKDNKIISLTNLF